MGKYFLSLIPVQFIARGTIFGGKQNQFFSLFLQVVNSGIGFYRADWVQWPLVAVYI
jgi:hypothetical protein